MLNQPLCVRAEYLDSSDGVSLLVSERRCYQSLGLCYRYRMLLPQRYSFIDLVMIAESITDKAKGYREGAHVRQSVDIKGLALTVDPCIYA